MLKKLSHKLAEKFLSPAAVEEIPEVIEIADPDLKAILSHQHSINEVGSTLSEDQKLFILKRLGDDGLVSLDDIPPSVKYIIEKVEGITIDESLITLKESLIEHDGDVNISTRDYALWVNLVDAENSHHVPKSSDESLKEKSSIDKNKTRDTLTSHNHYDNSSSEDDHGIYSKDIYSVVDWDLQVRLEAAIITFYSPYPEVRSVTEPFDDQTIACETIRVYILGIIWVGIGAVIDQFFSERQPSIGLGSSVVQIFLLPCGTLLHYIVPAWKFKILNVVFDLNPGPWTHKEQMLATLFYSVTGGGTSYVSYNIHVQKLSQFYNNQWANFGYQTLLILSTNFMGFGLAGIIRAFAVYPHQSVWPTILPTLAVNRTLMKIERKEIINGWKISSYKFFFITAGASFLYFWFPNYVFQALSTFNWISWIAPNNQNLVNITGSNYGLGFNPITTFDWNIISSSGPLTVPFYNNLNSYLGILLGFFTITGLWYSNYKWTKYIPINTNSLYTNTGQRYKVLNVINSNSLFDQEKYDQYGPPFYSAANLVTYGTFFAMYPFVLFYESILYWRPISKAFVSLYQVAKNFRQSSYKDFHDPYSRHMKKYKEVPEWIFFIVLLLSLMFAILCVKLYPAETPVWTIFFALGLNAVFLIPITAVYSRTGFSFLLNVLAELIIGYAIPGNGLALNFVKALGVNIGLQTENYISNQKQAHYLKIPPRALFRTQILSVIVASFVQLGIMNFQINGGIKDYCSPTNRQKFTCPGATTFYNASIAWGVIGPKKVFNGLYPVLPYCFLIGFLLVFPCIAVKWYLPSRWSKYFQPSIIMGGMLSFAPYNLSYYTPGLYVSYAFMVYIKKRYLSWWQKYTYILGAGLSAGVAFSSIIIFFAVYYHEKDIDWWGNTVSFQGYEAAPQGGMNATLEAPDGYFGPRIGQFP